ncbi:MAG: hypothetical protein ACXADW_18085 [Candidatus Hodarchaeales archaeon]|jgi:hypothetical protein
MKAMNIPVKIRPIKISGSVYVNVPKSYIEYLRNEGIELKGAILQITDDGGRLGLFYQIEGPE